MKKLIKKIPLLGNLAQSLRWRISENKTRPKSFPGSEEYWEQRYTSGGNSGAGSYRKFADFKAEILNFFVAENNIQTVIEFGCGDGNQLELANYTEYIGLDVSQSILDSCKVKFSADHSKKFKLVSQYDNEKADLSMSLDVIYHLVEDEVFDNYMHNLFDAATRNVIIYSSNHEDNAKNQASHVRHRKFTNWVQENMPTWELREHIVNRYPYKGDHTTGSFADFYIYKKN